MWYVSRRTRPDLGLLRNALFQQGPWAGATPEVTPEWLRMNMTAVIRRIDWDGTRADVHRFLPLREQEGLKVWNPDFFCDLLERIY